MPQLAALEAAEELDGGIPVLPLEFIQDDTNRWHGGSYDGWDRRTAANYERVTWEKGTVFMIR